MKFGKNMSRIGKQEILIPDGVEVKINGTKVEVKGSKGSLKIKTLPEILIERKDNTIHFSPKSDDLKSKAYWGLTRTLVSNMIEGVSKGFEKKLEINGVGFKVRVEGNKLILDVGFSHSVEIDAPEGIDFSVEKNVITVSGIDKELIGQVSAQIKRVRPPEPYKGKGIKYVGEVIRRKVGKKTAA